MRILVAILALCAMALTAGCNQSTNQGLVESQKQIDEANAKLEGRTAEVPAQVDP
ncbi:MAG: hypothetical protein SNJ76_07575 [Fimbriimonadaceae bacterium]